MSALATFPTGVSRIDLYQRYASKRGLIFQKRAELCERPGMQLRSLIAPSPYPSADTSQSLDCNSTPGAFGFINDLLRNDVIDVLGKASLFTRELLEMAFGATRIARLELTSKLAMTVSHIVHGRAAVGIAVRIGRDLHQSHIDAKEVIYDAWWRIWNIAGSSEVELATVIEKVRLTLLRFQKKLLAFPGRVRNVLSPRSRPNANCSLFVAQYPAVITDGTMLCKMALLLPIQFVGVRHLCQDSNNNLGTQRELLPSLVIDESMQGILRENLMLPSYPADPIAASVCALKSMQQSLALRGRNVQSNFGDELQYLNFTTIRQRAD